MDVMKAALALRLLPRFMKALVLTILVLKTVTDGKCIVSWRRSSVGWSMAPASLYHVCNQYLRNV